MMYIYTSTTYCTVLFYAILPCNCIILSTAIGIIQSYLWWVDKKWYISNTSIVNSSNINSNISLFIHYSFIIVSHY
jgi:hypothetical protein